jgi:hypothetical protein
LGSLTQAKGQLTSISSQGFSGFWIAARALTAAQKVKIAEARLYLILVVQYRQHDLIIQLDNFF